MSYIFSRALVEAYLEANCSESAPFAPSSLNPIPQAYCSPARMTAFSRLSRFGMTYAPLTDDRGAALLTWYREAFLAKTFRRREKVPALTAPAPDSGGKCTELLARYDLNMSLWRTPQCSLLAGLDVFLETWPRSGMMRNGWCWERTTWEPRTSGNASGYLHMIPTPTACNAPNKGSHSRGPKSLLDVASTGMMWPTPRAGKTGAETPQARDFRAGQSTRWDNPHRNRNLNDQISKFPTPTASCGGREINRKTGKKLITVVSQFPTPRTQGMCGGSGSFRKMKDLEAKEIITTAERKQMTAGNGGQLNPTWVEWLMGWPLEWTVLKPLATAKFRLWRQLHSGFSWEEFKTGRRESESRS